MKPIQGRDFTPDYLPSLEDQRMPPILEAFIVEMRREHNEIPRAICCSLYTFADIADWYLHHHKSQPGTTSRMLACFAGRKPVSILGIRMLRADQLSRGVLATVVAPKTSGYTAQIQ